MVYKNSYSKLQLLSHLSNELTMGFKAFVKLLFSCTFNHKLYKIKIKYSSNSRCHNLLWCHLLHLTFSFLFKIIKFTLLYQWHCSSMATFEDGKKHSVMLMAW